MPDSITQHQAVEIGEEEKLDTALSNPRTAYPRFTEEKCAPTDTFADTDRRSKNDGEEEILPQIPVSIGVKNTRFESVNFAGDDWRAHVGDVYNISYQESGRIFKDTGRRAGIQFSFGNHLMSGGKDSARRTRTLYVAKKKHTVRTTTSRFCATCSQLTTIRSVCRLTIWESTPHMREYKLLRFGNALYRWPVVSSNWTSYLQQCLYTSLSPATTATWSICFCKSA